MIKKWVSAAIIFLLIFLCTNALADSSILTIDFAGLGLKEGEQYSMLPHEGISGSNSDGRYELTDDGALRLTVSSDNTKGGHTVSFLLPEPVIYGTVAMDVKIKKEECTSGTRNLFMFKSREGSSLRTLRMSKEGKLSAVYEHSSVINGGGTFPGSQSGRWGSYTTSEDYYDIRFQFSRPDEDSDWSIRFYDKSVSMTSPFYIQSASAADLPELAHVSFELYIGAGKESDAALTFRDLSFLYPSTLSAQAILADSTGENVSGLRDSVPHKAVFTLGNTTTYSEKVNLYAAVYDGQKFIKAYSQPAEVPPESTGNIYSLDIEAMKIEPAHRVRLFVWRENMSPVNRAVQARAQLVGEVSAGRGDSMWLVIQSDVGLSADSLVPEAFELSMGEVTTSPEIVLYYPLKRLIRLRLPPEASVGIYDIKANVTLADGSDYVIQQKTAPVFDTDIGVETVGIKGVDIYKEKSSIPCTQIYESGTYTVVVRVTAQEAGGRDKIVTLYKNDNDIVTKEASWTAGAFSNEEQTFSAALSLSEGSTVFAIMN